MLHPLFALSIALPLPAQERPPLPTSAEIAQLPEDGGPDFNRLVFEQSPYLRQHAANPVDWYPWGDAAFERAAALDKPVFLSIGYSTCHWCHVMERESFEDADVAKLMNERFVCVKVDREERPDVDQIYMSVVQAMTGSGGWPLTVILTPDRRPFWGGTYFPKEGRFGKPGMTTLLPELATAWETRREDVLKTAGDVTTWLRDANAAKGEAAELEASVLDTAREALYAAHDQVNGGFGQAPKFPLPHRLRLLLREWKRVGDPQALSIVLTTLEHMRRGGIYDQLGGGFHRYSTDARWLVPHFEKMLYDQALLVPAYVEAWQATRKPELERTARDVLDYVLRELQAQGGGFRSAEDADSEGEEGRFYVWTTDELEAALGADDARLATLRFGVTEQGNLPDEATRAPSGKSILSLARDPDELARALELTPEDAAELPARLESIRARLLAVRAQRVRPFLDDKLLADWNGLAIAAFAQAGRAFDEPRYRDAARRAAEFVLANLRAPDGRLLKRWRAGEAALPAVLDDYAFFVHGLLELYRSEHDPRWLAAARELSERMIADFGDAQHGGFHLAADGRGDLLVRAREHYDGALPAGSSLAVHDLLSLARLTGETRYDELATDAFEQAADGARANPTAHTQLLCALSFAIGPAHEVVIVGSPDAPATRAMLAELERAFLPHTVVHLRSGVDGDERDAALDRLAPWTEALVATGGPGTATAYVCSGFACGLPVTDLAGLRAQLGLH